MKLKHFKYLWASVVAILVLLIISSSLYAQPPATITIGGQIYEGQNDGAEPVLAPDSSLTEITDATVMVQNQHSGGAFIAYGTVTGNSWTADVPAGGDYVIMFSAPDHDLTSREVTVDDSGGVTHPKQLTDGSTVTSTDPDAIDAYLPPLPLPTANLLVYAFYDNYVNGEPDDYPEDIHLNGVTWTVCPEDDYPAGPGCQTGVTGSQTTITLPDGTVITETDGLYYFTGLPPGEVIATSAADQVYSYPQLPEVAAMGFTASTEFYLNYTEEGGPTWDPKLLPGDPGTEDGSFLIWHSYVAKLGQFGDPTNPNPFNSSLVGSIYGFVLDADGNDPEEPFPVPGPPGVSPNGRVPEGLLILYTNDELIKTHPVATTEADPVTGEYEFVNVPPGRYKMQVMDVPLDYVWVQQQVTVWSGIETTASPLVPRFFGRGQGCVIDNSTGLLMSGVEVQLRYKSGSIKKTATTGAAPSSLPAPTGDGFTYPTSCDGGWYNFDDMPEIEVEGHVDVKLPPNYRGAMITDTFTYNNDPTKLPTPTDPYTITHNAMNRDIVWLTANYRADLYLEPIPATEGDIRGFVWNDHLSKGTWVGDGIYDEYEERTLHGVTVELWDAAGTTLITTTTTGKFSKSDAALQGYQQPYTIPPNELGGVYVGPMIGFYEFRGLTPGATYTLRVIPPTGFSPSDTAHPLGEATVTVAAGLGADVNFGVNTLVPLAGEIEGGVFDDLNLDVNPLSLLHEEKAGTPSVPVGVYDHLGYLLGAGYMGNPLCYDGSTVCPPGEDPIQKPEVERRFAPGVHLYYGNDPAFDGFNPLYPTLALPYTFGQGKYKFEADWSLPPLATGLPFMGGPLEPVEPILPEDGPEINDVAEGGSYLITGSNFGTEQGYSTVTLSGRELEVISWSDTEIHVQDTPDDVSGPMLVTTVAGPSNGWHYDTGYTPAGSVFVDDDGTSGGDGTEGNPYSTITEALDNLPSTTPRYVFVAPGTYNELIWIRESDIYIIGAGPLETTIDGTIISTPNSPHGLGGNGGPVVYIGVGGGNSWEDKETWGQAVENIIINGFTIKGSRVAEDARTGEEIGAGIFADYGNRNIDINNNVIVRNGGYYGGGIWLHKSNRDVKIWANTIAENGNWGGYSGGISVNDEPFYPEYFPESGPRAGMRMTEAHGEPEHTVDDSCETATTFPMASSYKKIDGDPGCEPWGTYEIYNNHIFRNFSPDSGGGIALYEIKDHLKLFGNLIEDNWADDHGGGAFFEETGPIDIYGNKFLHNYSRDDGGAISFEDVGDDIALIKIYNNLFAENIADDCGENTARGGALAFDDTFYVEVYNNTIVGNIVAGSLNPAGGGIDSERHGHEYNHDDPDGSRYVAPGYSDPKIYNNIIWDNWRLEYEQPMSGEEEDLCYNWGENYVWTPDDLHVDNPAEQDSWESYGNSESFTRVEYNVISDGQYASRVGNISDDPLFTAPSVFHFPADSNSPLMDPGSDWHLGDGSPAIDQAPVDDAPKDDLDRFPRSPRHAMIDMGAYEFQWTNPNTITIVKDADPADGTNFHFAGDLGSFSLDDAFPNDGDGITNTITYVGLVSGTYVITETIPAGWLPFGAECVFTVDNGGTSDLITDTNDSFFGVAVNLQGDEDVTCTITNELQPVLTVTKVLLPNTDDGLFNLQIDSSDVVTDVSNGGTTGAVMISVGSHTITETAGVGADLANYNTVIGGDCDADGNITLSAGETATCTITNTRKPTLTVTKVLVPDTDDGLFNLQIDGSNVVTNVGNGGSTGAVLVSIGSHSITETAGITSTNLANYTTVIGGDCDAEGSITLAAGETATCVITNTRRPTLTVVKEVVNDDGGTAQVGDFTLYISDTVVTSGEANVVKVGVAYTVSEDNLPGYAASAWSGDCAADGTITLSPGQNATCSITNDDVAATLTVIKEVVNDDGGTAQVGDFTLYISDTISDTVVTSGAANPVQAGVAYTVSEDNLPGYAASAWSGDCATDGTITLSVGQDATCTITNNDIAPTLTVIKQVLPDTDSGLFDLLIDSNVEATDVGDGGSTGAVILSVGAHTITEMAGAATDLEDYEATIGGDCNTNGSITLAAGENATCTITNTRKPSITSTPITTATEGVAYTYHFAVDNAGVGGWLTITAPVLPAWLTLTDHGDGTATLSGTPGKDDVGDHSVVIQITDGKATSTQFFTIIVNKQPVSEPPGFNVYLPVISKNHAVAPNLPDLVVRSLIATGDSVQVVIKNQGNTPVTDEFWVDVYINPNPVPSAVNQTWDQLASQGLVWGVGGDALSALEAGGVFTLTVLRQGQDTVGDPYYRADFSRISWPLPAGVQVYAQVDSADADTTYGAVLESHESIGGVYNNIKAVSGLSAMGAAASLANSEERLVVLKHLPDRP